MISFNAQRLRIVITALLVLTTLTAGTEIALSQDAVRVKERVRQFKKFKLIETLDMDEETAEKFFVRYNSTQKNIDKAREDLNETIKDLRRAALRESPDLSKINALSDEALRKYDAIQVAIKAMFASVREVLDPVRFAKFVIFEARFTEQVVKRMMNAQNPKNRNRRPRR